MYIIKQFVLRLMIYLSTLGALAGSNLLAFEGELAPGVIVTVSRAQVAAARSNFARVYDFFNFNVAGAPINIFGLHAEVIPLAAIRPRILAVRDFFNSLNLQLIGQVAVPPAPGSVNINLDPALLNQAVGAANNILQTIDELIVIDLPDANILEHAALLDFVEEDNSLLDRIDHMFEIIRAQLL